MHAIFYEIDKKFHPFGQKRASNCSFDCTAPASYSANSRQDRCHAGLTSRGGPACLEHKMLSDSNIALVTHSKQKDYKSKKTGTCKAL